MIQYRGLSPYERFQKRVDASGGPDACHPWTGGRNAGYGLFSVDGKPIQAPRWLLGYLRGKPLERHEYACHHCDNRVCCNPAHLYVGDALSNRRDAVERGRARFPRTDAQKAQTHCLRGHDLASAYVSKQGKRQCEVCRNQLRRARYQRERVAA